MDLTRVVAIPDGKALLDSRSSRAAAIHPPALPDRDTVTRIRDEARIDRGSESAGPGGGNRLRTRVSTASVRPAVGQRPEGRRTIARDAAQKLAFLQSVGLEIRRGAFFIAQLHNAEGCVRPGAAWRGRSATPGKGCRPGAALRRRRRARPRTGSSGAPPGRQARRS